MYFYQIINKIYKNKTCIFLFNDNHFIINKTVITLTGFGVITASLTPGGASCPFSAENCRETIGKLVAVVANKTIFAKFTSVIFGATLNAFDTQFTVSGRGSLHFPAAFVSLITLSRIVSIRIAYYYNQVYVIIFEYNL